MIEVRKNTSKCPKGGDVMLIMDEETARGLKFLISWNVTIPEAFANMGYSKNKTARFMEQFISAFAKVGILGTSTEFSGED